MRQLILVLIFIFLPFLAYASTASDFKINNQATYDIPYGTERVLIFDLTLPIPPASETYQLESITLHNAGTADHTVISKLEVWEDGKSLGWDGDETEAAIVLQAPFFDTKISGNFKTYSKTDPWQRIFVTVDLESGFIDEKTLQLQLLRNSVVFRNSGATGPTDAVLTGLERVIRYDASIPVVPVSPFAQKGETISTSTIRWYFSDLSNNEFGFKILDGNLKEVARKEEANLSYLDETGLQPDTEYSGRQVFAFNDRGESFSSALAVFPAARTLALVSVEAPSSAEATEGKEIKTAPVEAELTPLEKIQAKIVEIQQKILEIMNQLNELLKQQAAEIWQAFSRFLQSFFGK